ncbi:MAG: glycosyltransferase [Caldilineae bacterium]|nr:glycosyltransferase [Caldilineae bacterium]
MTSRISTSRVALLSANPADANPYVALLRAGLASAGIEATLLDNPEADGLPEAARRADIVHLHWLELWGRPPYHSLQHLNRWGLPGRGVRRWLEPALNSPGRFETWRARFLDRFFAALAQYKADGGRLVYTLHNWGQHEGEHERTEQAALDRFLGLVDAVHVHAEYIVPELQARLPKAASPVIRVIPHGNYIGVYPNTISRSEARRDLGITNDSFACLFFGLIRPYKGLEELLPAFAQLADPHALLLIAGQSRPRDYAGQLAAIFADGRVRWHPQFVPANDIQVWMNGADVVVLPYRRITTSGAAMLAWSFGKPVLAPRLPAFVELMDKAPFLGELYDPADPAALTMTLQNIRRRDWSACRPDILRWAAQFNWQRIGREMASLYDQALRGDR